MLYILFILLTLIMILTFKLLKSFNINTIIIAALSIIIVYFVMEPKICMESSLQGGKLFLNSVFPALFPFMVITGILISYGGINAYSKVLGPLLCKPLGLPKVCSFPLVISALCGYPLGAKYSSELYEKKLIDLSQYAKIINVASNASPLFIVGAIGTAMLKDKSAGNIILMSNYISSIIMAFILKCNKSDSAQVTYNNSDKKIFGEVLKDSIDNALKTSLSVGSFIVIFSVITAIIKNNAIFNIVLNKISNGNNSLKELLSGIILGFIEITNGCYSICLSNINYGIKVSLISFLCGFSGLSIISQVHSFTYKHKELSIKRYILRKFIQGNICFLITLGIYNMKSDLSVFNSTNSNYFDHSTIIVIFIFLSLAVVLIEKLFDIS